MSGGEPEVERLSLAELKRVADTTPQRYLVHAQVDNATQKPTQQGKTYLGLKLADGGENLTWRVFDGVPWFFDAAKLRKGEWVEISADWVDTGRYGIEPRNVTLRALREDEVQAVLAGDPAVRERQRIDYEFIADSVRAVSDPRLRGVCQMFLQLHGERFRRAAAARDFHHARRGGLVEHVSQMMRCAIQVAVAYPQLNRDLLVAGVLFHDCGKLWENNYAEQSFSMPYSLHGELMGHITLGLQSIVVASTATHFFGHESAILRRVFWHSLALASLVGLLVLLLAYVWPFHLMVTP